MDVVGAVALASHAVADAQKVLLVIRQQLGEFLDLRHRHAANRLRPFRRAGLEVRL